MSSEPKVLPPVQRHITTHDADGKAVWDTSLPVQVEGHRSGGYTLHQPWANLGDRPDHNGDQDLRSYHENLVQTDIAPASGSVVRVIDFWPGSPAVMHRTASVDYGVVLEGEIECFLDGGASRTFRRGDIIIQRGTNHAWKNTSSEIARVFVTLLPTPPIKIQGKELEVHHLSDLGRLAEEGNIV